MPISVTADPIDVTTTLDQPVIGHYPAGTRNPALDQTFIVPSDGLNATLSLLGGWKNVGIVGSPVLVTVSLQGTWRSAVKITATPITVTLTPLAGLSSSGGSVFFTSGPKSNWVKWSDIGNLDFTVDRRNVAGERPLDWNGTVHALLMLGKQVIAYGANGVSRLTPSGSAYGLEPIYPLGLKNKQAVAEAGVGVHYFVDVKSQLWKLSGGLELLDYSEYLSTLGSTVLSWNPELGLLHICDGTVGFVYNPESNSLGRGPVNVTGIDSQNGTLYVVSPATISMPVFEIVTDIYDLGSRHAKSIQSVEYGINATVQLDTRIEFRQKKNAAFLITNWYPVDSRGVRYIECYGYEFKFHLRAASAEWLRLDYVRVNGVIHDH